MAIPATQMRPGMIIKHNNELHAVFSVEHRTPGNLRAFIQAKLRNLRTGAMFEHAFGLLTRLNAWWWTRLRWIFCTATAMTTTYEHRELRADASEARYSGRRG